MNKTGIEWCTHTWNPITGCTKCSPGCLNCYAERVAQRLRGRCGYPADDPFKVTYHADRLIQPERCRKPARVFVCSMGDLFHEDIPYFNPIGDTIEIMRQCPQHTFLVLTKRAYRLPPFDQALKDRNLTWPKNLHLGVSISNQEEEWKIPLLLETSAAVKFISYEPALESLTLEIPFKGVGDLVLDTTCGRSHLDWVIAGCESGPGRRPAKLDWFRSLRDECIAAGVPYFLKQAELGGKVVKMPDLDSVVWDQLPTIASGGYSDSQRNS